MYRQSCVTDNECRRISNRALAGVGLVIRHTSIRYDGQRARGITIGDNRMYFNRGFLFKDQYHKGIKGILFSYNFKSFSSRWLKLPGIEFDTVSQIDLEMLEILLPEIVRNLVAVPTHAG
jgi:hypothetical protein